MSPVQERDKLKIDMKNLFFGEDEDDEFGGEWLDLGTGGTTVPSIPSNQQILRSHDDRSTFN